MILRGKILHPDGSKCHGGVERASAFSFVAAVEYALRIESEATGARWADPETWRSW